MNDERDFAQMVNRGSEASSILANPIFKESMSKLKDEITREWHNCPIRDTEGQQLLLQLAKIADKFEGLLVGAVETGKMGKIRLEALRSDSPAKRLLRRAF